MNRKRSTVILITALGVIILSISLVFQPGQAQTSPSPTPNGPAMPASWITVTGTGAASGAPDQAIINLGVQTDADTASEALTQNNQQMQSLLNALTGEGIARQDIRTQTVQLQPRYSEPTQTGATNVAGYTATNIVEVRVRNLNDLGDLLDTAVQSGANSIQSIRMEISDQGALASQAREAAMNNARQKAQELASLANGQLGEVISISESSQVPFPFGGGFAAAEAAVPIESGTLDVVIDLQVTWRLVGGQAIPGTGATATRPATTAPAATATTRLATATARPATATTRPATTAPASTATTGAGSTAPAATATPSDGGTAPVTTISPTGSVTPLSTAGAGTSGSSQPGG